MQILEQLFGAEPIYFVIAGVSTLVYLLKFALFSLFGVSKDGDSPMSNSSSAGTDLTQNHGSDVAFKLFSAQTLHVFLMGVGWFGLAARTEMGLSHGIAAAVAGMFGFVLMVFTAFIAKLVAGLSRVPVFSRWTLIGSPGTVYLTIPPMGKGEGEVEVVYGGGKKILQAITHELEPIASFSAVKVTGVDGKYLIVKRKN